jgi:glycosyltransferase involved in cell wall biosynthesis
MSTMPSAEKLTGASKRGPRVAVVAACPLPARRGTPIRIFRIAEAMHQRGCPVQLVTYHLGEKEPPAQFPVHRIAAVGWYRRFAPGPSYKKLLVDARLACKLRDVLLSERIDVIHAHHYEGMLCALYANRGIGLPIVFDVHTLLESELPMYRLGLPAGVKRLIGRRVDAWLPRRASHVIAVSGVIKQKLLARSGVAESNISIVPNGAEITAVAADGRPSEGEARPVVLFTGNLAAYQDIEVLLRAFALLKKRSPPPILRIVTDDDFSPYQSLASELGIGGSIAVAPGTLSGLPHHLATAAVAVNPRRVCDGVPQKLLNYMAAGRAVVTFSGSARHVAHKESAWIADEDNPAGLARGIDALLDDPRLARRLGAGAARVARRELSWDRAAEDIERVCRHLIAIES